MSKKNPKRRSEMLPVLHPDAAGVDIGAEELFVAVPRDRDSGSVRRFSTFTRDLLELADWLKRCGVRTVAMESTSVYWIPLYQILETHGFEVLLVNAQYVRNVPGRKRMFRIASGFNIYIQLVCCAGAFDRPILSARSALFGDIATA
jgi:transposase